VGQKHFCPEFLQCVSEELANTTGLERTTLVLVPAGLSIVSMLSRSLSIRPCQQNSRLVDVREDRVLLVNVQSEVLHESLLR
jgi:hypothetical protein